MSTALPNAAGAAIQEWTKEIHHGMVQARAHALLKAKDMELRTARDEASAQFAAELADARAGLAESERQLAQVHTKSTSCTNKPC